MLLLARCAFIADHIKIGEVWTNMTNNSGNLVYVNSRVDFLLAINVQSKIVGKKIGLYININYTSAHGSGRRYYILLLKFLSFFLFFLSPQDLRDGSTNREPF